MSVEVVRQLTPTPDGVVTSFFTPTRYEFGSLRVAVNGVWYEAHDDRYGWTEVDDRTIELAEPPRFHDLVQAFYTDLDATGTLTVQVIGSPFHPTNLYP